VKITCRPSLNGSNIPLKGATRGCRSLISFTDEEALEYQPHLKAGLPLRRLFGCVGTYGTISTFWLNNTSPVSRTAAGTEDADFKTMTWRFPYNRLLSLYSITKRSLFDQHFHHYIDLAGSYTATSDSSKNSSKSSGNVNLGSEPVEIARHSSSTGISCFSQE
jgi:hypothetical protein